MSCRAGQGGCLVFSQFQSNLISQFQSSTHANAEHRWAQEQPGDDAVQAQGGAGGAVCSQL